MDSLLCKIVILRKDDRKILKPKNLDINFKIPNKGNSIKKCLFGVPQSEDTDKMLEEQFEIDRKRFMDRFGIDLKEIEELERQNNIENIVSGNSHSQTKKHAVIGGRVVKRNREVFRSHNCQSVITDFYQARKTVQSNEKCIKESKEN